MTPRRFRGIVYRHYEREGRHHLPWRATRDPYHILVSEVMLQQTQVDRVIPYFERFIARFPTIESLSRASLGDVLRLWQGLGYNRRARMLHECARVVMRDYEGKFPPTEEEQRGLPGVGPYTAGAVMTFAFDIPVVMIETNIRTAHLHHFFSGKSGVHDRDLMPLIAETLDVSHPREWYAALMDYGSYLKRTLGNASRNSAHHVAQSRFKGSDREIRGAILRALVAKNYPEESLVTTLGFERKRTHEQLSALESEGMIVQKKGVYRLP